MELIDLKARVYDLLSMQQQIQMELNSVNQKIAEIQRINLEKERSEKPDKLKK
jgi:hypothetical protein